MEYFDFTEILYDELTDRDYSGISETVDFPSNSSAYIEYKIQANESYRPDKLAYKFYNNEKLDWIIDEINNFSSLEEYYCSRIIKILKFETLERLGITV